MRYKVTVAYDGTNYKGWQRQPHSIGIQQIIEEVLCRISGEMIDIVASGRTDRGVHAKGQVFHFDTKYKMDVNGWKRAFNALLPSDIYVTSVVNESENFHARFNAIGKHYEYKLYMGEKNIFLRDHSFYCYYNLNMQVLQDCCKMFEGTHDFSSFCTNEFGTHPDQVRTIYECSVKKVDNEIIFTFRGKGFLRYMVRMLVGTMIEAARGKITVAEVEKILLAKSKDACRYKAKACGLYLVEVLYEKK